MRPEWDNGGINDEPVEPVRDAQDMMNSQISIKEHELLKNEKRSIIDNDVIVLTNKQKL